MRTAPSCRSPSSRVGGKVPPTSLYVVDSANARVMALDPLDLELIWVVVGSPLEGQSGSADGQLLRPEGIAACGGLFAVADTGNCRVALFQLDGKFERHVGGAGSEATRFVEGPSLVALDASRLYVVEADQPRVQVFSLSDGEPLRLFLPAYSSPTRGMCVGDGFLYISIVSEHHGPRVIALDVEEAYRNDALALT